MLLDLALVALLAGSVVYGVMYFRSRRTERFLLESRTNEARYRDLTQLSADWFWETDAEHRITWLSGGTPVATFFGSTATFGKRFWEIPRVEVEPRALAAHLERLDAQLPFFDLEIARADERGARQIHIISGQSRLGANGTLLGYRGVGRDITEQRRAERALFDAKERLERAIDGANLAEWHIDLENSAITAGDGWTRFLGHARSPEFTSLEELFGLIHADDQAGFRQAFVAAVKGDDPEFSREFRLRTRAGDWRWLHARGRVTERGQDGRARRMSGTLAAIDERKRAEAALAEREQRFRDVAEASGEYVWETDEQWRYTFLSERVEALLGYTRAEMLGRRPQDFMPLGEQRAVQEWFAKQGAEARAFRDLVHRLMTKEGGVIWQAVSGVAVRDAAGSFKGYRGTAADVTARKTAEARIEYLATRDPLTALPNRLLLADRAGQAILAAARGRTQVALLCIDLDRFKLVNDSLGHPAGDVLLRAVAERLGSTLREDTFARLGGDDFALLRPGIRSAEDAAVLAQRILAILARPFSVEGRTLNVGASIGISIYPNDGRDFAELLKNADTAMYHAKESGRGTWRFFAPTLHARSVERLRLENELRGALARSELVMHWQPVVQRHDEVVGAEALVRWNHPERGLLLPDEFVPLAEECGLIRAVGEWTLERALSQAGAWQRTLPGKPWFAINVSAPELAQGDAYVSKISTALKENHLEGSRLELEITERVLMSHLGDNLETLRKLAELGVRFAIDDFGTGYSSLAYLRVLPIHKLKIDRSFLRTIDSHRADEAIVRAIATLARTLGIAVAAEGVENESQLARLLALGCEQWQGHHFSAPLEPAQFEALVHRLASAPARAATPRGQ